MRELEDIIIFQLERTNKMARLYSQREFDNVGLGITIEQWIILKIIHDSSTKSQKEIADLSLRDPASITRTMDILQKKGFIIREAIPNNRRQFNIVLTSQGNDFVKKNMPLVQRLRNKSVEGFTEKDILMMKNMLLKIQANFS